jgi:hypothetical protein
MNKWIKKSIKLTNSRGYLDRLYSIYPILNNSERPLDREVKKKIRRALAMRSNKPLIAALLVADVFPIKHSYVAFLRAKPDAINLNPKIIARIGRIVRKMSVRRIFKEMERPIESNRQMGPMFRKWLRHQGYRFVDEDVFLKPARSAAFLNGSDTALKNFCNKRLSARLKKGPDLVFKIKRKYFIGEAKFVTAFGGHQGGQISDAMKLLHRRAGKATRIAIYDGVIWLNEGLFVREDRVAISALLFKKFISDRNRLR